MTATASPTRNYTVTVLQDNVYKEVQFKRSSILILFITCMYYSIGIYFVHSTFINNVLLHILQKQFTHLINFYYPNQNRSSLQKHYHY